MICISPCKKAGFSNSGFGVNEFTVKAHIYQSKEARDKYENMTKKEVALDEKLNAPAPEPKEEEKKEEAPEEPAEAPKEEAAEEKTEEKPTEEVNKEEKQE